MSQVDFGIRVLVSSGNSGQQQRRLRRDLRETQRQAERTGAAGSRAMAGVAESTERASHNTRLLRNHLIAAAAAFGGLTLIPKLFAALDQFGALQNRLRVVTEDGEAAQKMFQRLSDVALSTRSSLRGTVEMFTRISLATKELGLEQERVVKLTRSINQAIIISGATAKEAENGLIQLSQGLASGALRGDELRSVLEQLPAVADVIASRMKVTRGELRKLGEQGLITTGVIINAFEEAAEGLQNSFGTQIVTLSQSLENLKTVFTRDVGQAFSDFGGMTILIGAVQTLNVAIPILFKALMILAVLFAGRFAAGVYLSYWRLVTLNATARATTVSVGLMGEAISRTTVKLTLMQRVMKLGVFGKFALIATGISLAWTLVESIFSKSADAADDLNKKFEELDETLQSAGIPAAERMVAEYEKYGETVSNIITQLEDQIRAEQELLGLKRGYQARQESVSLIAGLREQIKLEKERLAILSRGYDKGRELIEKNLGDLQRQVDLMEKRNRIELEYGTDTERARANAMLDFVTALERKVGVDNMEAGVVANLIVRYAEAWDMTQKLKKGKEEVAKATEVLVDALKMVRDVTVASYGAAAKAQFQVYSDAVFGGFRKMREGANGFLESLGDMNDKIRETALEFGSGSLQIAAMEQKLMEAKIAMDLGYLSAAQYNTKVKEMATSAIDTVPAFATLRQTVSNFLNVTKEADEKFSEAFTAAFDRVRDKAKGFLESLNDLNDKVRKTAADFGSAKLASEQYLETVELLDAALGMGLLTQDEYNAALTKLANDSLPEIEVAADGARRGVDDLSTALWEGFAQSALSNTENAIADFVVRGRGNFKAFVTAVMEDLLRMITRLLILLPLINALKSAFGNVGGGTNLDAGNAMYGDGFTTDQFGNPISQLQNGGSFLVGQPTSRFPGFANGGSMMVGGNGGTDSQLVAFRASPNERVTVTRPEQSIGGNTTVNVSVHNNAPGTEARVEQGENGDYRVLIEQVKGLVASDISRGGTGLNAALEGRYGLNGAAGIQLG